MRLSKNFSLKELIRSETATRKGINNNPNEDNIENLQRLCDHVLQPVRDHFGPVRVNSGYRGPALNKAVGGSSKSQHSHGEAADFECSRVGNDELAEWVRDNLEFDQLILEFYQQGKPSSGWVHCSYKTNGDNRQKVMTALRVHGKTQYKEGIVK